MGEVGSKKEQLEQRSLLRDRLVPPWREERPALWWDEGSHLKEILSLYVVA